jgi:hypothetical protein
VDSKRRKLLELRLADARAKQPVVSAPSVAEPEQPGMLESAGLGALQGGSFGFADEAEAGVRSVLPNDLGGGSYEDLISQVRNRYKEAEEANPWSYGGGQILGGIAVPAIGAGGNLGRMVIGGAVGGAANSIGTREDDKLSKQALIDAGEGAVIGGALTGVVGSALPALGKYVGKKVAKSEMGEDVKDVFNKIRSGEVESFGRESLKPLAQDVRDAAKTDILGNLDKVREFTDSSYKNVADQTAKIDTPIDVEKIVNELRMKMPGSRQGVSENDLKAVNQNLGDLLGEQEVAKRIAKEMDPAEAESKVMNSLRTRAAQQEARAERNYARKYLEDQAREELGGQGIEGQALQNRVNSRMQRITNEDIDAAVAEIRDLNIRQRTAFPPEFEVNPETGLNVGIVKRADADTTMSVPDTKFETIKEMVPTKSVATVSELKDAASNIKGLMTDSMKQNNPALFKYIQDTKNSLEAAIKSNIPEEISKAKNQADALYRDILNVGASKDLGLPANMGTSYRGLANQGRAESNVGRMIKNMSQPGHDDALSIENFLNRLRSSKADEIGLESTGIAGPATIDDIANNLKNRSRNLQLAERATSTSGLQGGSTGVKGLFNLMQESVKAKVLGTAEIAGKVTKATNKVITKGIQEVSYATPNVLKNLATKVTDNKLSEKLVTIANAPEAKRRAMIFALMQQPVYRELINDANVPEEETGE